LDTGRGERASAGVYVFAVDARFSLATKEKVQKRSVYRLEPASTWLVQLGAFALDVDDHALATTSWALSTPSTQQ
jgi:hypothetical protein